MLWWTKQRLARAILMLQIGIMFLERESEHVVCRRRHTKAKRVLCGWHQSLLSVDSHRSRCGGRQPVLKFYTWRGENEEPTSNFKGFGTVVLDGEVKHQVQVFLLPARPPALESAPRWQQREVACFPGQMYRDAYAKNNISFFCLGAFAWRVLIFRYVQGEIIPYRLTPKSFECDR